MLFHLFGCFLSNIRPSHLGLHCYLHHGGDTVFHVGEVVSIFQGGNGARLPGWTNLMENLMENIVFDRRSTIVNGTVFPCEQSHSGTSNSWLSKHSQILLRSYVTFLEWFWSWVIPILRRFNFVLSSTPHTHPAPTLAQAAKCIGPHQLRPLCFRTERPPWVTVGGGNYSPQLQCLLWTLKRFVKFNRSHRPIGTLVVLRCLRHFYAHLVNILG